MVFVVCSGRIEREHVEAIKQFMNWLSFKDYKKNFAFIYNKSDGLTEAEKFQNLSYMCDVFDVDQSNSVRATTEKSGGNFSVSLNMALGFPPNAEFESVQEDWYKLGNAVTLPRTNPIRIPVSKSSCTIL